MADTSNQQQPPMGYVRLGKSGLKVSKVILGCMTYGSPKWDDWVLEEEKGVEHIKAAYDMGINAFDTANIYSNGLSEVVLGKAIKKYNLPRDEIVVMTKFCYAVPRDTDFGGWLLAGPAELDSMRYTNQYGASRKHIFEAIKHSLQRLQLDYVDVYQLHRFDPNTPIEETMHALHDVVKAGYARYIGMSSCYAWQFHKMQAYAREHGLTQFISMQNYHNAVYREEEREMTPLLQDMGVGMIPWSPLARGFLTRPIEAETTRGQSDMFWKVTGWDAAKDEPSLEINKRVAEIAKKYGVSMAQVALAWSLSKPFMTAPIIGTSSLDKLKDTIRGANLRLSEEDIKAIDEPYKPKPITGHW